MPVCSDIQERLGRHEQWLISLRQDPTMTTAKIQTKLENYKGLKATPSQLEIFFRHLGQRKNLSRHEWISVFRALDSQKAFGNHYGVYLSERLLTEQELKKKRKNAKPPQPLAEDLAVADRLIKQLPNGITVRKVPPPRGSPLRSLQRSVTPRLPAQELSEVNQNLGAGSMLDRIAAHSGLSPAQDVLLQECGVGSHFLGSAIGGPSNRNQPQLLSFASDVEEIPPVQAGYEPGEFEMDGCDSFPILSPGAWDRLLESLSPGPFLQSLQSPGQVGQTDFWFPGVNYASPTNIAPNYRPHDLSPIESARLLLRCPGSMNALRGSHYSNELTPTAEELLDNLQSLVLVNADGPFCGQSDVVDGTGVFTDQFIQMLLFSVVNDFAGLEKTPVKLVIKFINEYEPARRKVLRHLTTRDSTIHTRALAENLLKAAITAGDARTVHDILTLQIVKPDEIVLVDYVCHEPEHRMTAIEQAAKLGHLDVLEQLLRFDGDVNKTYKSPRSDYEKGGLECAIGRWGEYRQADIRLVDLLLDNGATVKATLLDSAVRWGDTALVDRLSSKISSSEHEYFFREGTISDAAQYLKNDAGYKFVQHMMNTCQTVHDSACFVPEGDALGHAICQAARRNNRDLVELLLPHASQEGLDWALTAAARFGSHSLVQLLIAHGASVNGQPVILDSGERCTTPLAEAIRKNDDELLEILVKQGAWKEIDYPDRLEAAMCAIAESGNSAYLPQILQSARASTKEALDEALFYATKARREDIALKLLEAGASPITRPDRKSLVEALRIKSHSITWAMLECDMRLENVMDEEVLEAAIAWGDLEIIKAFFFLGNSVNIYWGRPPLSFAIKAGKRSVIDFMISLGADLNMNPERKPSPWPSREREGFYKFIDGRHVFVTDGSERFLSPLAAATFVRDEGVTTYLLDHGADPGDEQAVLNAIIKDRSLLDLILQRFRQRYPGGRTGFGGKALLHTLKTRDEAALDLFLRAGFDVNVLILNHPRDGSRKVTALGFAIENYQSRPEMVSKLLDTGGDPNSTTSMRSSRSRQTALLDAVETKSLSLVELLVHRGADVQKEAKLGVRRTPLQKACEVGSHSVVDFLLSHNADVNAAPAARHGDTALQIAAKAGSLRMAKKLLDLGAKVDTPGGPAGGRSAIEYAAECGRLSMIPVLFNAAGGKFVPEQCTSATALAKQNGHLACAGLLTELSTRNQAFLDASGMADHGGGVNVVS